MCCEQGRVFDRSCVRLSDFLDCLALSILRHSCGCAVDSRKSAATKMQAGTCVSDQALKDKFSCGGVANTHQPQLFQHTNRELPLVSVLPWSPCPACSACVLFLPATPFELNYWRLLCTCQLSRC